MGGDRLNYPTEHQTQPPMTQPANEAPFDPPLFSVAWYRKRAEQVRYNGETVSRYNYFLAIADAIERTQMENAQDPPLRDGGGISAAPYPGEPGGDQEPTEDCPRCGLHPLVCNCEDEGGLPSGG